MGKRKRTQKHTHKKKKKESIFFGEFFIQKVSVVFSVKAKKNNNKR
jgi:hypothetical protein